MAEQVYDGFISYSHAADGLLAPRLQAGLQRFAKPWWKRRAVRIFRDESSLSANPHLWSSITDALDSSGWFVLLLSPDAAASEWVNQEIAYWKTHRDPSRILPVLTDGEFGWSNGDVTGDAVPDQLNGVFADEPRWVDLRWARDEDQLDLKDPRFADAVADIASALRGVPKDDLASEEVRQHRRTVRTAWSAGGLVLALAVVAVWAGILSARNAAEAERQAHIALENEQQAEANAAEAERQTEKAEANAAAEATARAEADQNAQLAQAREYAAAAINVLEEDPELAARLIVHASSLVETGQQPAAVVDAMWRAGMANKLAEVIAVGGAGPPGRYTSIDFAAEGESLVVAHSLMDPEGGGLLVRYDLTTGSPMWEWAPDSSAGVEFPAISPDGRLVAVALFDGVDGLGAATVILDFKTGHEVQRVQTAECVMIGGPRWSPDGARLATATGPIDCWRDGFDAGRWVEVLDTSNWESVLLDPLPPNTDYGSFVSWTESGELYVFGSHDVRRYSVDLTSYQDLVGITGFGDVSPDGARFATYSETGGDLAVYDTSSLDRLDLLPWDAFPRFPVGIEFTADGRGLVVGTEGDTTTVFDLDRGFVILELPSGAADQVLADRTSRRVFTSHSDGTVKVWDPRRSAFGPETIGDLGDAEWVNGDGIIPGFGGHSAVWHADIAAGDWYVSFFDDATGRFVGQPFPIFGAPPHPLADGRFVVRDVELDLVIVDPIDGPIESIETQSEWLDYDYLTSVEGEEIALVERVEDERGSSQTGAWMILDIAGAMTIEEHPPALWPIGFTDDVIVYTNLDGETVGVDRATNSELWRHEVDSVIGAILTDVGMEVLVRDGFTFIDEETGELRTVEADMGRTRAWQLTPDQSRVVIGDEDKFVIYDVESGRELQRVPIGRTSDFHWLDDSTLVLGTNDGLWARVSLDEARLLEGAKASLREGFSRDECVRYGLDPCPTLEELRDG